MDYIELLKDECPPAIVQYVTGVDMTMAGVEPWPNNDYVGSAVSDPCHIAALLYRGSVLPANVEYTIADYLVRDTAKYFERVQDEDHPVLITAMRQMATRDQFPQSYFAAVTRHRIDVIDVLQGRYPALPVPEEATPEANFDAFAYLRYMTAMGDGDAFNRLIEAMRLEPSPSVVSTNLGQIQNLRMPQKDAIFQLFINDTRQSLSATRMPGIVVANTVRRYLGLPKHEGPYRPLEHNGQPYQP